jgi:hypothetical protein
VLTSLGRSLEPVLVELSRWGAGLMDTPREGDDLRPGWAAVAVRSAMAREAAGGSPATYELRIDGVAFHLSVGDGQTDCVEAWQGSAPAPDLVVAGDAESFVAVASGKLSPEEAVESGVLWAEDQGDQDALLAWSRRLIGSPAA